MERVEPAKPVPAPLSPKGRGELIPDPAPPVARPPAPFADLDRAFAHLHAALADLRFLYGQNAGQLMDGFRHLIARSRPTAQEVKMLHGLARQLEYAADQMRKAETHLRGPK